jgi:hypothetical protein
LKLYTIQNFMIFQVLVWSYSQGRKIHTNLSGYFENLGKLEIQKKNLSCSNNFHTTLPKYFEMTIYEIKFVYVTNDTAERSITSSVQGLNSEPTILSQI